MEIELPDGTVLEAPDGSDPKTVVKGYRRQQLIASNPGEYDPNSKEFKAKYGPETSAGTSFFSGVKRMDAGFGNLARKYGGYTIPGIMGKIASDYTSDENLREMDQTDKELIRQHPVARVGGEVAATIPAALATGGASSGLATAGAVGRTLANPFVQAGLQGALSGAAGAPVDNQGSGALKGAATGVALQGLFGLGGRALNGIIKKSEEAEALQHIFAQQGEKVQPPISQVAGDQDLLTRLGKSFYQEALPLVPGVKGKLERQAQQALEDARRLALQEAAPGNYVVPADAGRKVAESMHGLRNAMNGITNPAIESLEAAAHAARVKGGNFSMADLARKASDPVLQDLGVVGHAVLGQPATKTSLTGRILAGAGIGGFGAYMSPVSAGASLLGGNIMATKAFQRALLGDTQAQEALKLFISQHPEMASQIASMIRMGAASQAEGDQNGGS